MVESLAPVVAAAAGTIEIPVVGEIVITIGIIDAVYNLYKILDNFAQKISVPTIPDLEKNCIKVGQPIVVPSTRKGNKGGSSWEQEYLCGDGRFYTIHRLYDKNGKLIDEHVRPGSPKYGPKS